MKTRLKEARVASGLSQQEASVRFRVSLGTYRNWEQGRVVMNGEQLIRAAQEFDTTVDYLLMTDSKEDLSLLEDDLVGMYRSMNDDGRRTLIAIAETLADLYGLRD